MKNVFLTSSQMDLIRESIEFVSPKTATILFDDARKYGFDVLDDRVVNDILKRRYNEIISYFSDDVTSVPVKKVQNKMNKLIARCIEIERPLKDQLAKLCLNTIIEMFDMPEGEFDINCYLVDSIDPKHQFHIKPDTNEDIEYDDYEAIKSEDSEVKKRKLINCVISGGAYKLMDYAQEKFLHKLFELNEELPHLYSKIMKLNELLLFSYSIEITDRNHMQSGTESVILGKEDDKSMLECKGIIFPFLMYETIKSVLELLASKGLPTDVEHAKTVINKSDTLELDPTNMRIGPIIWDMIFGDTEKKAIPNVFHKMVKLNSKYIEEVFNNICFGTKLGRNIVSDMNKEGKYDMEYNTFNNSLLKKQNDVSLISDSYFLSEDLQLDNRDSGIMKLIECDPSEIEFGVADATANMPFVSGSRHRTEYQLYPTVEGIELGPKDGINFRAEEVYINGQTKYQLHIYIAPELRRNGIASKLYEAFIKQGYPVVSLTQNRTATYNREHGSNREEDSAIENMWAKLAKKGLNIRNINGDEGLGVETY